MEEFDFEELIVDMLNITDEQRGDYGCVRDRLYDKFSLDYDHAYTFVKELIPHT